MKTGRFWMGLFSLLALLALVPISAASAQDVFPEVIPLPDGFQPEGIAVGKGSTFYAGSIPTGAIYRGDLRTGEGEILVAGAEGRMATGLDYDRRSGILFVSGAATGKGFAYDGESGELLAEFQFTPPEATFINDVIVTREGAYFTNSQRAELYFVPLGPGGQLPDSGSFQVIPLSGDYQQVQGFNANGIVATPNGKWLIIVNSTLGTIYRVDPSTGEATLIEVAGDPLVAGDGLLLDGKILYVVQNQLNQISVVRLDPHLTSGEVVDVILDANFRVPTTIAEFGNSLYAVNARFGTPPTPETEYEIVKVDKYP